MRIKDLLEFIEKKIPTFTELEIIESGIGYHYTMHSNCIEKMGKFLGRTIDENIDKTQLSLESVKATDENGIVFAYPDISVAIEEGQYGNCHIYEIQFLKGIGAFHQQEFEISESFGDRLPKTILIPAHKITQFKLLGRSNELNI